ncbi:hypothetical protein PHYBOEH_003872 [Phytophthora boehmeriae]|uniref:SUN domain-containing protein n=1 Tax=Phytophthora boehmeriae TaxID=109152 RepID=A0A8T1X5N5_9STRA|nr:hypothetical protein PHYBOEH_003872 [Phytophthora boehmeriae]
MRRVVVVLAVLVLALPSSYGIVTPDAPSSPKANGGPDPSSTDPAPSPSPETSSDSVASTAHSEPQPVEDSPPSASPQRIAEPDEPKADAALADEDVDVLDLAAGGLFEVVEADSVDAGKRQNYASLDAGATILDASADTKSPTNLLVPDKDRYMLTPCSNPRKWVVISLSEDVHADAIAVANYEKFSSPVKDFIVLGSVNYPTDTWLVLGNFTATHTNGEQIFQLDAQQHVRYIKFRFLSHYGSEYYCTLSQLRVFGRTFTQVISQLEKSIDAEVELDAKSSLPVPQLSGMSDNTDASVPRLPDPTELVSQCLMEKNNTIAAVFYDKVQQNQHYRSHGMCCLVDYTPEQIEAEVVAHLKSKEQLPSTTSSESIDAEVGDGAVHGPDPTPSGPSSLSSNASSVPSSNASGNSNVTTSSNAATPASLVPAMHGEKIITAAVSSTQGLGRLESIFVRITKKIQYLEANQSIIGRQLEELHTHQWAAIKMLQANQEALNDQLVEIRTMIVELKDHLAKELSANEQTLQHYGRLLNDLRRDNIALWNEMLIVREVITTMKAGILCAIILSGFIILFYLFRLLFRCVLKCKERADLREWFWRMENHESSSAASGEKTFIGDVTAGALRVNRKAQFGSSWDDSAIERKTLVSDMIGDGPQKLHRPRGKRSSQPSMQHVKRSRK